MQDPLGVRVLDGRGRLGQQPGCGPREERSVAEAVLEGAPEEQFHREEGLPLGRVEVEDADDVRVLQAGSGAGLGQEPPEFGRGGVAAGVNHLEGDVLPGPRVARVPDDAHAALTEPPDQLVTRHHADRGEARRGRNGRRVARTQQRAGGAGPEGLSRE